MLVFSSIMMLIGLCGIAYLYIELGSEEYDMIIWWLGYWALLILGAFMFFGTAIWRFFT